MNRRGFLAALIGGATLDPERLLWRPGAKLISIPKPRFVLLGPGDMFTIAGIYSKNPMTGEIAIYTDPATGARYRFRQRFVAGEVITNHDGDGEWARKSFPKINVAGSYGVGLPSIDGAVPWETAEPISAANWRLVEPVS